MKTQIRSPYDHFTKSHSMATSDGRNSGSSEVYFENGRGYSNFRRGTYPYPIDEAEKTRMDMIHTVMLEARRDELHRARIESRDDKRILDLGTGTGIWALDIAERYPEAEVLGIDLVNIQPPTIPRNLRFNIGIDYLSPWSFGEDSWDLIHIRQGLGSVQSWPALYQKIFVHLKPGLGSIEQVEIDLEPRCDDGTMPFFPLMHWYNYLRDATRELGRPIEYNHNTREMLERAGFVDIEEQVLRAPFNTWPKDSHQRAVARRYCACLLEWLEALSLQPMTKAFGWTPADIKPLLAHVCSAILHKRCHAYHNIHVWTGRRPEG